MTEDLRLVREPIGTLPSDFLSDPKYTFQGNSQGNRVARVIINGEAKQLTLKYFERRNEIRGRLDSLCLIKTDYLGRIRIPGETTALFKEGKLVMYEMANALGRSIVYTFRTGYPQMYSWAIAPEKGGAIFGWTVSDFKEWEVSTTICP